MKRYLILTLLGIVVLISGPLVGCDQSASPKPFPPPESESEEITSATPDSQELLAPEIYEKDIEGIPFFGWLDPELAEMEEQRSFLRFQVEAGNRVEGEVILTKYHFSEPGVPISIGVEPVFARVRDPYGNIILETSYSKTPEGFYRAHQKYPWQFAFFAPTGGEYSLQVAMFTYTPGSGYEAHLKVTVYRE